MFSRFGGAALALGATILFVVALVTAWWSGLPNVNGQPFTRKTMSVTLFGGAEGCNVDREGVVQEKDGKPDCEKLKLSGAFSAQAMVEGGAIGLAGAVTLLLAVLALVKSSARRKVAKLAMVLAGIAAIVAVALIIQGPKLNEKGVNTISVPLHTGMLMFGIGTMFAIIGSVFALQPDAAPRPKKLKQLAPAPQMQMQNAPTQQQQPFDVQALLQDDALRPTQNQPHQHTYSSPVPQQSPLFQGAPQLRPLYEAAPNQGGTGGYVPGPAAPLPTRPPTPVPRDAISSMAGIPTPPAIEAQRMAEAYGVSGPRSGGYDAQPSGGFQAQPSGGFAAQSGGFQAQPSGGMAAQEAPRQAGKTLPPPVRGKPMTAPPPIPLRSTVGAAAVPPPVPLPAGSRMPPPQRGPQPTSVSAAVPPPSVPFPAPPPAGKRAPRVETDPDEGAQTVEHEKPVLDRAGPAAREFDASIASGGARILGADPHAPTAEAQIAREENTDVGIQPLTDPAAPEATGVSSRFEMPTTESRRYAADDAADPPADPPAPSDPEDIATSSVEKTEPANDSFGGPDSGPLTIPARPAEAILQLAAIPPPPKPGAKPTGQVAAVAPPRASAQVSAVAAPPKTGQVQIPISTAPESLPPPTAKQAASAGPSPACPQCEAPMAWVEEHLRFYCKSCKMYF